MNLMQITTEKKKIVTEYKSINLDYMNIFLCLETSLIFVNVYLFASIVHELFCYGFLLLIYFICVSGRCSIHVAVLQENEEIVDYISTKFKQTLRIGDNVSELIDFYYYFH